MKLMIENGDNIARRDSEVYESPFGDKSRILTRNGEACPEEITLKNFTPEQLFCNSEPDNVIKEIEALVDWAVVVRNPRAAHGGLHPVTEAGEYLTTLIREHAEEIGPQNENVKPGDGIKQVLIIKNAQHLLTTLRAAKKQIELEAEIKALKAEKQELKDASHESRPPSPGM